MQQIDLLRVAEKLVGTKLNGFVIQGISTHVCPEVRRAWGTDVLLILGEGANSCPVCRDHDVPIAMWWASSKIKRMGVRWWAVKGTLYYALEFWYTNGRYTTIGWDTDTAHFTEVQRLL